MPVTAKCTFNLTYKSAGNSFSLYNVAASLEALGVQNGQVLSPVDRLWRVYLALLGAGVEAPYVRISDEAVVGDSLPFDRQYVTVSGAGIGSPNTGSQNVIYVKTAIEDAPDFYDTSILLSLAASTTQKGRIFMRFIPDGLVEYPVGFNPNRAWSDAFNLFKKQLLEDKWCLRSLAPYSTNPSFKIKKIFRTAADADISVETFDTNSVTVKDTVRISRVSKASFTNGLYTVGSITSGTTFTLLGTPGTTLTLGSDGTIRKLTITYPQITNAYCRYVTRRKSGRPFGAPAGRRKRPSSSL